MCFNSVDVQVTGQQIYVFYHVMVTIWKHLVIIIIIVIIIILFKSTEIVWGRRSVQDGNYATNSVAHSNLHFPAPVTDASELRAAVWKSSWPSWAPRP